MVYNKEAYKRFYEKNKEKKLAYQKEYDEKNKEKRKEYHKQYYLKKKARQQLSVEAN